MRHLEKHANDKEVTRRGFLAGVAGLLAVGATATFGDRTAAQEKPTTETRPTPSADALVESPDYDRFGEVYDRASQVVGRRIEAVSEAMVQFMRVTNYCLPPASSLVHYPVRMVTAGKSKAMQAELQLGVEENELVAVNFQVLLDSNIENKYDMVGARWVVNRQVAASPEKLMRYLDSHSPSTIVAVASLEKDDPETWRTVVLHGQTSDGPRVTTFTQISDGEMQLPIGKLLDVAEHCISRADEVLLKETGY